MNSNRFSQTLQYADGAAPCYNGNISSNLWQDNQGTMRRYDYSYDGLNRLVNAAYTETRQSLPQGLAISGTPVYSAMYEYDLNGNATFIRRNGIIMSMASRVMASSKSPDVGMLQTIEKADVDAAIDIFKPKVEERRRIGF